MVTKRLGEVRALLEAGETSGGNPDTLKLAQIKLNLKEKLEVLKQLDGEILDHLDKEEEIVQCDDFKQSIYEMLVRIDKVCEASPISPPTSSTSATSGGPGGSGSTAEACSQMRLPKINFRSFNGDITKWTTFRDAYKAAIHTNLELSNIEKFTNLEQQETQLVV